MTKHCSLIVVASATLLFTSALMPAYAGELSDAVGGVGSAVGNAAGGISGGFADSVNSVTGPVGDAVNGVTGDNAQTTAGVDSNGELSLRTRSRMANGINAEALALSPNRLAQLCVSAGGGEGCGSGDRSQILGIIDNRLEVIGDEQLASLCLSTGANGCGGGSGAGSANPIAALPGAAVPANDDNGRLSSIAAKLSNSETIAYKKRCSSVLRNPRAYENDIVQICKLIN